MCSSVLYSMCDRLAMPFFENYHRKPVICYHANLTDEGSRRAGTVLGHDVCPEPLFLRCHIAFLQWSDSCT